MTSNNKTLVISSQRNLLSALYQLRTSPSSTLGVAVDAAAAKLQPQEWGALLGAIASPNNASSIHTLSFVNIVPSLSNLVVPHIASVAANLPQLQSLSITRAPVTLSTAQGAAKCLSEHPSLRRLVLEQCELRDDGAEAVVWALLPVDSIAAPSKLETLDLGHNDVRAETCRKISAHVQQNGFNSASFPNLYRVNLRGNHHEKMPAAIERAARATKSGVAAAIVPELSIGENLKFLASPDVRDQPMPALETMSKELEQDLSQKKQ